MNNTYQANEVEEGLVKNYCMIGEIWSFLSGGRYGKKGDLGGCYKGN